MNEDCIGTGRSKADAKQVVARMMLEQLSLRGYKVPAEFASPAAVQVLMDHVGLPTHSFVVLVKELCQHYRMDPVEYEELADPYGHYGQSQFVVKARLGLVERVGAGNSRQIAQHLAAEQIYRHLRSRLHGARSFDEEQAIYRAYARAMAPSSDEDDQSHPDQEQAAAAPRPPRKNYRKKRGNKKSAAVRAAIRLETEETVPGVSDVRPPSSSSDEDDEAMANNVALKFISRTMDRLGI